MSRRLPDRPNRDTTPLDVVGAESFRGGSGEPLLLVHGLTHVWRTWDPVIPALAADHDVLVPTLAGHLGGPAVMAGGAGAVAAVADQLERDMDAADMERAHLAGNSMGGWLTLDLARRGRALSVVAFAPCGGWEPGSNQERRLSKILSFGHWGSCLMEPFAAPFVTRPGLRRLLFSQVYAHPERLTPDAALLRFRATAHCHGFEEIVSDTMCDSRGGWLREVDVPVLLVWPENDQLLPREQYSQPFVDRLPHAELRVVPDIGHVPMSDDPELIVSLVRDFVARHPQRVADLD